MTQSKTINKSICKTYEPEIVWRNVALLIGLHFAALYGIYLKFASNLHVYTRIFFFLSCHIGGWGVTAARHRYYSHRSFSGNRLLNYLMVFLTVTMFEQSIFTWVRDHRLHHKHSDSDADPYNAKRGFFFSHMGWMMVRKHPDVKDKGKTIDMSDLEGNQAVMFEYKYSVPLAAVFTFLAPVFIPCYFWKESFAVAVFYSCLYRYLLLLHATWSVNSFAHMFGMRPYDEAIAPRENTFVATIAAGEGFHNYHHAFPWDYKTGEFGGNPGNVTTCFIDFLALCKLVTVRKTATSDVITKRVHRTGNSVARATRNNYKSIIYLLLYWVLAV